MCGPQAIYQCIMNRLKRTIIVQMSKFHVNTHLGWQLSLHDAEQISVKGKAKVCLYCCRLLWVVVLEDKYNIQVKQTDLI